MNVVNVADGDRHPAHGADLTVDADDAVHVMSALVARALFGLQQTHPDLAMPEVADSFGL